MLAMVQISIRTLWPQ